MKRLFIAIKINPDEEFLDQLQGLREQLGHEKIKWVEEQNIHITLKFLGETEEERVPGISSVLQGLTAGTEMFSFYLKNLGIFGSAYDPRVVWVGIEPYHELVSIMKALRDKMNTLGFEADRQNVVPHLTMGRIKFLKDKKLFHQVIEQHKEISSRKILVDRFILFESVLKKEGPIYLALQTFPLRKP